jgi:CheY-like chemotaxis protein
MVHGMAGQMGGRLIIHSKLGEGTTAEIWLPAAMESAETEPAPADASALQAGPRKLKVLAVDDDRLVLFNTVAMLEDLGHDVVEAGSGAEALEHLAKQNFDLVITDQSMPRMSGTQLMDAIAQGWPGMKMILATGYAELPGNIEVKVPRLGKPFNERDLKRVLAAL